MAERSLKIFLCHASEDKPAVLRLHERLMHDGAKPWLDVVDLLPGQDWDAEIAAAVRSCDVVVVCVSRLSSRKKGYVQKEIRYALDVADEQPERTVFVIPARLDDCEMPERLRRWQWVDLFEDDGYRRLLAALAVRADSLDGVRFERPPDPQGELAPDAIGTLQRQLLPPQPPDWPGFETALLFGACAPAGGTFCEFLTFDADTVAFVVGEVSGKGMAAVAYAAQLRSSLRSACRLPRRPPARVIADINDLAVTFSDGSAVSLFYGELELRLRALTYVRAGCVPPCWLRRAPDDAPARPRQGPGVTVSRLEVGGIVLGLFRPGQTASSGVAWTEETVALRPGDLIAVWTDSIDDALNATGEPYGEGRLIAALLAAFDGTDLAAVGRSVWEDLQAWSRESRDDRLLFLLRAR